MILFFGRKDNHALQQLYSCLAGLDIRWFDDFDLASSLSMDHQVDKDSVEKVEIAGFSLTHATGVINALGTIRPSACALLQEQDRAFGRAELAATYIYLLNQLPNVINRPHFGHLSARPEVLTTQWLTVKEQKSKIQVPKFFFGRKTDIALSQPDLRSVIVEDANASGKMWKPNAEELEKCPGDESILIYERPKGTALSLTLLKSEIFGLSLLSDLSVRQEVSRVAIELMKAWRLDLATLLLFYDGDAECATYGSMQPMCQPDLLPKEEASEFISTLKRLLTGPSGGFFE